MVSPTFFLFLLINYLERDSNISTFVGIQAALIMTQLCPIHQICRGRGRCCIASGQAGKARCVAILIIDRPYLRPSERSSQFDYLCGWANSLWRQPITTWMKNHWRSAHAYAYSGLTFMRGWHVILSLYSKAILMSPQWTKRVCGMFCLYNLY